MKSALRILLAVALAIPASAAAQTVTITTPNTVNSSGQPKGVADVFVRNADGTIASLSGAGGSSSAVAQGSTTAGQTGPLVQCTAVTGNQTFAIGTTNPLTCVNNGRLKVAVSNAGNVDPAAQLTTTLTADLVAAKYYAARPTWTDGSTGTIQVDATGNLYINNATLPPGAATAARQPAIGTAGASSVDVLSVQGVTGGVAQNVTGTGTAGTPAAGVLSVQGVTNGLAQNIAINPGATAALGIAPIAGTAVASALVVKASAGNLYGVNVTAGATAGYVMVFNAVAAPADGAVTPSRCIPLAANAGIDLNYRSAPTYFATGITVVFSSTGCFSKTASATAYISADAK